MDFINGFLEEANQIINKIDRHQIDKMVKIIRNARDAKGRMFFLGVGGGAGHASHAVNDFRKICGIEAYSPTDNVSELTARVNDDGWESSYLNWLKGSRMTKEDLIFIFSVGGGHIEKNISANIVKSLYMRKN